MNTGKSRTSLTLAYLVQPLNQVKFATLIKRQLITNQEMLLMPMGKQTSYFKNN